MSVLGSTSLLATPEGYQISRSVRLRASATAYFGRTPGVAGNRKTWTWSGWVKRGQLGTDQRGLFSTYTSPASGAGVTWFGFNTSDKLEIYMSVFGSAWVTTQVFRDPSAWYHIVWVCDTTQATSTNRYVLYVNGQRIAAYDAYGTLTQNTDYYINSTQPHGVGAGVYSPSVIPFDGYLAEVNFIDGQALTPSSFGENDAITGVWKPKKYAGTYGTNGFYLNFSDNSAATAAAIGKDYSGNGNNWTPNNISVTAGSTYDSMLDVPTPYADGGNGRGNYCVLNPLTRPVGSGGAFTVGQGNLQCAMSYIGPDSTIAMSSGKWYWEVQPTGGTASYNPRIGIVPSNHGTFTGCSVGDTAGTYGYTASTGNKGSGGTYSAYGASYADNDIIGVALDMDAGTLTFYKNGTSQGTAYTGLTGEFFASVGSGSTGGGLTLQFNFGQRAFSYTPPTGFKALNTQNLPDSTIKKGASYFDVLTYTGTGGTRTLTGLNFQPDFVWSKSRSSALNHTVIDSVRGVGNSSSSKSLVTNNTQAESWSGAAFGYLSSFNSDGVTYTAGSTSNDQYNQNAVTYVQWNWKKGATQGFDIVTWTGTGANRTIAHSLGVAPKMIIAKHKDAVDNWIVYHASLGGSPDYLWLNLTSAKGTSSAVWNTAPTSSVFGVGTDNLTNLSGGSYVGYLFSEVAGFSKFGSYTGNASADGPFVYCGFRPRWILIKNSSGAGNYWELFDTARDSYNVSVYKLGPNSSDAENSVSLGNTTQNTMDILSNGFKLRTGNGDTNGSGATYIFAAFAENPFKNSLAR